ncbi:MULTISPECIES: TetR/AcrR family transcriptional regulator [Salinibaculum]|uniref:TetR/AcrR family transcriptional regulator n=1 Tax=Salinibaculum TaxID=2732368 RepID=UPI0030D11375
MAADDEILDATWRALCTHGYADLTMQDIADETTKSKAALHYHYDSKHDLLVAFLDHVADRFLGRVRDAAATTDGDAAARLSAVIDAALSPPETGDIEDMQTALLELKAQAPHESDFRKRLRESDEQFRDLLAEVLADGIDDGSVRPDVDPDETAHFVVTMFAGAQLRQVSVGESRQPVRDHIERHLQEHVYRPEASAE